MGGFGSGRPARGPTVESSLVLPVSAFVRQQHFQPGARLAGLMRWGNRAEISFEVLAHSNTASVRLRLLRYQRSSWLRCPARASRNSAEPCDQSCVNSAVSWGVVGWT